MENVNTRCVCCGKQMEDMESDLCQTCASKAMQRMGQKGGKTTKERHGDEHYKKIGRMGGQKVRELVERGKRDPEGDQGKSEKE